MFASANRIIRQRGDLRGRLVLGCLICVLALAQLAQRADRFIPRLLACQTEVAK